MKGPKKYLLMGIAVVVAIAAVWGVKESMIEGAFQKSAESDASRYKSVPSTDYSTANKQSSPVDHAPASTSEAYVSDFTDAGESLIKLEDDHTGIVKQTVKVEEKYAVTISVKFQYETSENGYAITSIDEATAKSKSGWQYVASEAVINTEKTVFQNEGMSAVVTVTYYAGVGEGAEAYDALITIDLEKT